MTSVPQNAPFTQTVARAMRALYPEELADRAWDNVGLLLGNMDEQGQRSLGLDVTPEEKTVLLTNDLTPAVADEAVRQKASVVVSYHPFIFRGLKSVDVTDPQQRILLQLAQRNIAVYCPHTAVDAVPGGLNDWLADMLCGPSGDKARSVAQPTSAPPPAGFEGSGYGRTVEFAQPVLVTELVRRLATGLGGLKYFMVAAPKQPDPSARRVQSAAVCAGSGWDVLKNCAVDVLVTGEMSHHNALRAVMENKVVITVFHSNSERAYLRQIMQPALEAQLRKSGEAAKVLVSGVDADPFEIWDVDNLGTAEPVS
ncbi:hypothetical protein M406DRAFT_65110 [Cryphonectria parasitica EP155]|uniref:Uncharacterized protein n=1 Tax=Cryphonectria parasitica (strain ATCC 38755 / EP155) TaxID=660469 RepID=A0A9P4XZS7_CRYP1|nr:uncharacterized protein M406DRAFT_65110 [Cryphonectria parasitica EP155]KAF3763767.1 hypothetical protein M406DRAFT_65110 [Cryphonectria parasitica EP155]